VATRSSRYAWFVGLAAGCTALLCAIGWLPTARLAGDGGGRAMLAGCGIALLSAVLAGALLVVLDGETPQARLQRAMFAMFARLAVVVLLGVAAALSGAFARTPLLFWMATAYVVLLPLEVRLAISD
jgi:hypothetical protein